MIRCRHANCNLKSMGKGCRHSQKTV
ncbi:MAG: hypothetical protein JWR85_3844, partial [Marmoricola sp.]|nr:hypothetical protein [Marmoricola sp.]